MTEDYLDKLEAVLVYLQDHPQTSVDDIKPLAEPYWLNIKQFLKDHNIVSFPDGYRTVWARTRFIDICLEDIQMQRIEDKTNAEKEGRKKREDLRQQVKIGIIVSLITIVMTLAVERLWQWATRQDKTDDNTEQRTDKQQQSTDSVKPSDNLF